MQFTIILSALAFASTAYARCYSGGESWGPDAQSSVQNAARNFNANSIPVGVEQIYQVPQSNGACVKFILENISGNQRTIYEAEAYDGFNKEFTGCQHGGDSSYDNWRYVADPNASC